MHLLFTLLILLSDIQQEMYSSYCTYETLDSIYTDCRQTALKDYPDDVDAGAEYLMADWAYGVSLLELSSHCITNALDAHVSDKVLRADCLSLASAVARLKGDLSSAISYAEECLLLDRESGKDEYVSSSLNNIAGLYMTYGEADVARKYIDEAIGIEKDLGRSAYLAIRYGVASEIYLNLGEKEKALEFADEALRLDSLDGRWGKVAVRRSQKGGVLMEMGNDAAARRELELAVPVFRKENNLNSLAISLAQLGEIAFRSGDHSSALEAFDECVDVCVMTENIYIESRVRRDLWQLYREKDSQEALIHLERHVDLQSELNNDKTSELMRSFDVKYETLKKEQTIALQKSRLFYIGLALVLFVLLAVAGMVLAFMKNKVARAMEERNAVLVKANLDKDRLLAIAKSNIPKEVSSEIISITSTTDNMPEVILTKREMQIAELAVTGMINKEIADKLGISQRTVETHKNNLYKKLGINNTVELLQYINKVFAEE